METQRILDQLWACTVIICAVKQSSQLLILQLKLHQSELLDGPGDIYYIAWFSTETFRTLCRRIQYNQGTNILITGLLSLRKLKQEISFWYSFTAVVMNTTGISSAYNPQSDHL